MLLWIILSYIVVVTISARRVHAEQNDNGEEAWLLLDNLDTCVCVLHFDTGEILYANKKVREEFGLNNIEPGHLCWQVFREGAKDPCEFCPRYTGDLREGSYHIWESFNPKTKKYYQYIDSVVTWMGDKAHMQHFMDFTEHKETEIALAKNKEDLEAALENAKHMNDAKSDFLSRMSHEIKTPMNAILGLTKIAKQSLDEPDININTYLDIIETSAKQLMEIINDIFDVTKIETRKLELVNASFNFKKTMSNLYNEYKKHTDEKKQQFSFLLDDTISTMYIGDETRLSQVVDNLLSNAVKFTPEEGRIVFSARQKERVDDKAVIEVSVSDSGIGVSKENIVKLFMPFEQIDGSISRKYGGTGLGLVLSKNIVELMEGGFEVNSEEGKGSTFTFTAKFTIGNDIPKEHLGVEDGNGAGQDSSTSDKNTHESGIIGVTKEAVDEQAVDTGPVPAKPAPGAESEKNCLNFDVGALMPYINVKRGLENLKGNWKLYILLLRSYQENDLLARIQEALSGNNFQDAIQSAHALKSIVANIAFDDLRTKMDMLEESLRSLIIDYALMDKLKTSEDEIRKLIPNLIIALEEGKLS